MSMFLPEGFDQAKQSGVASVTPANPETTTEDIALMQRVLSAASRNVNLIPTDFMAYLLDYMQTSNLEIPIGQVFGYQRLAPQVIADFAEVPSPIDGQIVLLKVGASSPFTYVQMMYDQKFGHWVSEEFSLGGGASAPGSTAFAPSAPTGAMSWQPVHRGGLTLQLKWAGFGSTSNAAAGHELHAGIYLYFVNIGSSFTNAQMSDQTTNSLVAAQLGQDWASVTDPGDYSLVLGAIYGRMSAGGDLGNASGAISGRFIK